jgi:hypothetical protein
MSAIQLGPPPSLSDCPFCGNPPAVTWRRSNPKAGCATPACWGSKLPVICLDDAEQVAAWNMRASLAAAEVQPDHLAVSAEEEAATDAKLGLVLLPPIRVTTRAHALMLRIAEQRGLVLQAVVREALEPGEVMGAEAQPDAAIDAESLPAEEPAELPPLPMAAVPTLSEVVLPPIDRNRMIRYDAIRYVDGYPDSYVKEYALALLAAHPKQGVTPPPAAPAVPPVIHNAGSGAPVSRNDNGLAWMLANLLRDCVGPLEVSAALIEDEDGSERMEALIASVKYTLDQIDGARARIGTAPTTNGTAPQGGAS